jgi:hypothetical protein
MEDGCWVYRHIVNFAGSVKNGTTEDTKENRDYIINVMLNGLNSFKA